jgi:hypothetical protein
MNQAEKLHIHAVWIAHITRAVSIMLLWTCFSGPGQSWPQCQNQKIVSPVPCTKPILGCQFGLAVDADDRYIVVGAPQEARAYVFKRTFSSAQFMQALQPPLSGPFATAVSVSGDWIAITAPSEEHSGLVGAGAAYLFRLTGGTWVLSQKITASDASVGARFGHDISAYGDRLLIGAAFDSPHPSLVHAGSAYVFELQGPGWVEIAKLVAVGAAAEDHFGSAVAMNESRALIGAPQAVGGLGTSTGPGRAFLFQISGSTWTQLEVLDPPDGKTGDVFGWAVACSTPTGAFLVGAPFQDAAGVNTGAVYVFQEQTTGWPLHQKVMPSDNPPRALFGSTLAAAGIDFVVGAPVESQLYHTNGAMYHFRHNQVAWEEVGKFLAPDSAAGDNLAFRGLVLFGDQAFAGAHQEDEGCAASNPGCPAGAVYVIDLLDSGFPYCSCPMGGACGNAIGHGGCLNSTGDAGILQGCGSGSTAKDNLKMESCWLPTSIPGIAFMGSSAQQTPFGDGQLCVGPGNTGMFRFPPQDSGTEGVIKLGPGIVAYTHANFPPAGQIQAGDTWYFQTWYRDPNGPCGTDFNLTNGLKVEFTQ